MVQAAMWVLRCGQARSLQGVARGLALSTGSLALGGGVWAMHFIGMLALIFAQRRPTSPG